MKSIWRRWTVSNKTTPKAISFYSHSNGDITAEVISSPSNSNDAISNNSTPKVFAGRSNSKRDVTAKAILSHSNFKDDISNSTRPKVSSSHPDFNHNIPNSTRPKLSSSHSDFNHDIPNSTRPKLSSSHSDSNHDISNSTRPKLSSSHSHSNHDISDSTTPEVISAYSKSDNTTPEVVLCHSDSDNDIAYGKKLEVHLKELGVRVFRTDKSLTPGKSISAEFGRLAQKLFIFILSGHIFTRANNWLDHVLSLKSDEADPSASTNRGLDDIVIIPVLRMPSHEFDRYCRPSLSNLNKIEGLRGPSSVADIVHHILQEGSTSSNFAPWLSQYLRNRKGQELPKGIQYDVFVTYQEKTEYVQALVGKLRSDWFSLKVYDKKLEGLTHSLIEPTIEKSAKILVILNGNFNSVKWQNHYQPWIKYHKKTAQVTCILCDPEKFSRLSETVFAKAQRIDWNDAYLYETLYKRLREQ
ncbi:uncharacterized protein TRIADDRAFT_56153 [Trichoplax adhaerens]|uniref:TIR domain-containing protein n=1 Tax=Trichoplax adhaerens TaxID=10228 RepID=B3RXB8_TRIAD|nr:predicted protein [Trichoplax adhaerens]EDV24390.1 predicted protein [Trichoplax adhaerens]|eukprot:XP_002112280.1 predicted protein [Trichoplax adhaerens]